MSKKIDPSKARTIEELRTMYNMQPPESIPYTRWLNDEQNAITNEMSNYGSDLAMSLASLGVVCCLGATTGCLINKCCTSGAEQSVRQPNVNNNNNNNEHYELGSRNNPIVIDDLYFDENDSEPDPMEGDLPIKKEPK